jgi:hypothetical protein
MRFEIARRADDRGALVGGNSHGDHVALDELAEVDAGIEMAGDEVEAHLVVRGDVEDDVGIGTREWAELRCQHHRRRQRRDDESHAPRRPIAKRRDLSERVSDVGQRRVKASDELVARISRCDAPGCPRQQPNANLLLKSFDRMAQC